MFKKVKREQKEIGVYHVIKQLGENEFELLNAECFATCKAAKAFLKCYLELHEDEKDSNIYVIFEQEV